MSLAYDGKMGPTGRKERARYIREFIAVTVLLFAVMAGFAFIASENEAPAHTEAAAVEAVETASITMTEIEAPVEVPEDLDLTKEAVPVEVILARAAAREASEGPRPAPEKAVSVTEVEPLEITRTIESVGEVELVRFMDAFDARKAVGDIFAHVPKADAAPPKTEYGAAQFTKSDRLHIVIDKVGHTLSVFEEGVKTHEYGCAVGKNQGNKIKVGDMRTPEGKFTVDKIHDSTSWTHDFKDGKGVIKGAYGPYFIRLLTPPWTGIGIHGTHDPDSIGKDVTEGCIRLHNDDLRELVAIVKKVGKATTVEIHPTN